LTAMDNYASNDVVWWHCWLDDRKGVSPVRSVAPAIPRGSLADCQTWPNLE